MVKLGVNIDHIATVRQARRGVEPDPIAAARICERSGCHSIVAHLREDRRHIQDGDVWKLRKAVKTRFNLEMSLQPEIVAIAARLDPDQVTIVPERRQEITTEGGLDVAANARRLQRTLKVFHRKRITVSLFIAPQSRQILACRDLGISMIELHTGRYAEAKTAAARKNEFAKLAAMTQLAQRLGMTVNAGHGLNYENTPAVARIPGMEELNIGHAIIARAVFIGLGRAVKEMLQLIHNAA